MLMGYSIYRGWFGENQPLQPMHYANLKNDRDINPEGQVFLITSSGSMSKQNFDIQSKMCSALGVKMLNLEDDQVLSTLFNECDDDGKACIPNAEELKKMIKSELEVEHYALAFDYIKLVVLIKPRSIAIDMDSRIVYPLERISEMARNAVLKDWELDGADKEDELYQGVQQDKIPVILAPGNLLLKYFMNISPKKLVISNDVSLSDLKGVFSFSCGCERGIDYDENSITVNWTKDIGVILGRPHGHGIKKIDHQDRFYCNNLSDTDNSAFYQSLRDSQGHIRWIQAYKDSETVYHKDITGEEKYKKDKKEVIGLLREHGGNDYNSDPQDLQTCDMGMEVKMSRRLADIASTVTKQAKHETGGFV